MNQANFLKIAAVAIAAPRYVGAFGASIGVSAVEQFPLLVQAELITGGAMAVLEGFALAFILGKMAMLDPSSYQHKVLKWFAWSLVATLPAIALPYLLTSQMGISITKLFSGSIWTFYIQILWSLVVLMVPVLVVMAVGYADVDDSKRKITQAQKKSELNQVKQQLKQVEQKVKQASEQPTGTFPCLECNEFVGHSIKALNGHMAGCKARANGKQQEAIKVTSPTS